MYDVEPNIGIILADAKVTKMAKHIFSADHVPLYLKHQKVWKLLSLSLSPADYPTVAKHQVINRQQSWQCCR